MENKHVSWTLFTHYIHPLLDSGISLLVTEDKDNAYMKVFTLQSEKKNKNKNKTTQVTKARRQWSSTLLHI